LQPEEAEVVVVAALVQDSQHRVLKVKPTQEYILAKTVRIIPATVVAAEVVVADLLAATVEQSVAVMQER
jgi:hypothetical protein